MRISTSQLYTQNTNHILKKQSDSAKLLEQLASGKKVNTAGDDPMATLGIDNINQQQALVDQFLKNIDYANNHLSLAESKLGGAEELVMSMRDKLLAANNGSLTDSERQTLARELRGSLNELMSIANSRDESGNYLFAGFKTDSQPFGFDSNGKMQYGGDNGVRDSLIARGLALATNITGAQAFMNAANPLGDYGVNYLSNQAGDFRVTSAKITDPASYSPETPDTYSFAFTDNGAGGMAVQITGGSGSSWTIDPVDPAAPLSFNGLEIQLQGTPAVGDAFDLTPQQSANVFDTLEHAIGLLETGNTLGSPSGQAELAQILDELDSGLKQLGEARSQAGNGLKALQSAQDNHGEETLVNSSALSLLEDLDYAAAISEFQQQQLALNAVSSVFSKVGGMSLFDYL